MPSQSTSSAPLLGASRGRAGNEAERNRQAELAATFDDSDDEDGETAMDAGYGRRIDNDILISRAATSNASSPPHYAASPSHPGTAHSHDDVFFDAGDAIGFTPASLSDPLGAQRVNNNQDLRQSTPQGSHQSSLRRQATSDADGHDAQNEVRQGSYDFERASYFAPPRTNISHSSSLNQTSSTANTIGAPDTSIDMSGVDHAAPVSSMSRVRMALGRFGQFVGMRVPGATYSSLNGEDDRSNNAARRRIMGSGINQDGVFANLNAKPERRRRRSGDDRGDDDDLVDDVHPPSYETAAADAAPPYWETTIIGGPGGFHPLAPGGAGWTPGGAHVGALEDLIVEGLPIGNFFGFAWNLLVSMSFQFIGFLLTYLLHTTHAARCGSRAGLGITLVQYGFFLRTRAAQMAEGKLPDDILGPGVGVGPEPTQTGDLSSNWFSDGSQVQATQSSEGVAHKLLARSFEIFIRQSTQSAVSANGTLADALANDDGTISLPTPESMSASTEWLAYILMGLGWFILLTSLLSYWRVHRWAKQLVDAAHRENENTTSTGDGATTQEGEATQQQDGESNSPVGFFYTVRNALRNNARRSRRREMQRAHSAEDWIIFPGRPRRDIFGARSSGSRHASGDDLPSAEQENDLESSNLSVEERRLLEDMRSVGLIN